MAGLLWFLVPNIYAQDAGTQSLFMEMGMGARAQGFGKAFVAVANDGSAVFWNPAGLDYIQQGNAIFYHTTLVAGYSNFASVTYPFLNFGTFGLGVARFAVDGIYLRTTDNADYGIGDMNHEEFYLSYGKKLPWFGLSLGTTVKIIRQSQPGDDVMNVTDIGTGLDVGLMYKPEFESALFRNMAFGMNIQNIIRPKTRLQTKDDIQPINFSFGIAKDFYFGGDNLKRLTVSTQIDKSEKSKVYPHFGMEYTIHRMLTARTGFDNGQMAFGVGTEFVQYEKFQVDYSINIGNKIGTALHRLALTVHFGKTIDERIEIAKNLRLDEDRKLVARTQENARLKAIKEHRAMGQEHFQKGNLLQSLVEYEQLSKLDPDNEEAKLYLDSINYLMDEQLAKQLADTASSMAKITIDKENNKFVMEHFQKGRQLYQKEDYIAALSEFQNALDRSPNNTEIINALNNTRSMLDKKIGSVIARARASAAANNFAEALKLLSEARALDPNNQNIQKEIDTELKRISNRLQFLESTRNGLDSYQKGDYAAAIESFEKALLIDPTNATVREYHKKAIVRGFASFKTLEGDYEKWYLQGVDLYVEGKYQQAILIWQRILEKDPYNKRVLNAVDKAEEQLRNQKNMKRK